MAKDAGLYLCRDIYYSIEYDSHAHVFDSFFVHNNIVSAKGSVSISSARDICELDPNLHVKISTQHGKQKMLLWHYQAQHKNIEYLKKATQLTISRIRDWEIKHKEIQKIQ